MSVVLSRRSGLVAAASLVSMLASGVPALSQAAGDPIRKIVLISDT
jgi:hypothetical protein